MKKKHLGIAAAAVVAGGLAIAGPAMASGTNYKVDIGGLAASAGNQPLTASSTTSLILKTSTSPNVVCTSGDVPASPVSTVTNSPSTNVLDLASLTKVNFNGCTLNGTQLQVAHVGTWKLHGVSGATNGTTDTINGHIDGITANVTDKGTGGSICKFTVTGLASGTYKEDTKVLTVNETIANGGLTVSGVSGCGGTSVISNGQKASFTGTFQTKTGSVTGGYLVNVKP